MQGPMMRAINVGGTAAAADATVALLPSVVHSATAMAWQQVVVPGMAVSVYRLPEREGTHMIEAMTK